MPSSRFRLRALIATIGLLLAMLLNASPAVAAPGTKPQTKAAIDTQIDDASQRLSAVVEQYDAMRVTLADTRAKEARLAVKLAPLQRAEAAAHAKVGAIAARVYQTSSPAATFGRLLASSTTTDLVNELDLLNEIAYAGRLQLANLTRAASAYVDEKQRLEVLDLAETNQYALLKSSRASILAQISQLKALRLTAYGSTGGPSVSVIHYLPVFTADAAGKAVRFAYAQLGKSYRFGASGPKQYDCSGLTMSAWASVGVSLPHSAAQQYRVTKHISASELRPGDLVFYFHPIHHVGIYIGGGNVINAPTYGQPVQISPIGLASIAGYSRP